MVPDPALALEIQSYLSIGPALRDLPALQSWVETQKKNYNRTQAGRGHEPRATDDRKGNDCFCPGEVKRKSLSCVRLFVTPWTIQSMEFYRPEYWSGFSSVQFSCLVMSNSLRPHEPQHARPPCPSPTPGVHPIPSALRW